VHAHIDAQRSARESVTTLILGTLISRIGRMSSSSGDRGFTLCVKNCISRPFGIEE
jgi:hypothetical protein